MASIWYIDLEGGDDAAGTGAYSAPYKTHNKAFTSMATGDEIRIAKNTTADTTITASTTWTHNSLIVTIIGTNQTAAMTAGSYIGKPTAAGNGAQETFYRVTSSAYTGGNTVVTLTLKYLGATATVASIIKKFIMTDTGSATTFSTIASTSFYISSYKLNITISGGWNLSTQTRDGESWFKGKNADWSTTWSFYHTPGDAVQPVSITYVNVVETYRFCNPYILNKTTSTFRYCSIFQYDTFYLNHFAGETIDNVCLQSIYTGAMNQDSTGIPRTWNNILANGRGQWWFVYNADQVFNNCLIGSNSTPVLEGYSIGPRKFTFNNTSIIGTKASSTVGLNIGMNMVNVIFTGTSRIESCGSGIYWGGTQFNGMYLDSPNVYDCTYGINYSSQKFGSVVYNYTADACDYCCYFDIYSRNNKVYGFNWTNITTYGYYHPGFNDPIYLTGGTVDAGGVSKLIYNPSVVQINFPKYIATDITNITNGTYWNAMRWKESAVVYRTTPNSMEFTTDTTLSNNYTYHKMFSGLAESGKKYAISVWIKSASNSWSGTIDTTLRLGDTLSLQGTQITSATTTWTQYTFTMPSSATYEGELSIAFKINMSAHALYFDDFTFVEVV